MSRHIALEKRLEPSPWLPYVLPILAIALGAFGSLYSLSETMVKATPLMLAGLGAYLFGGVQAFQLRLQALGVDVPTYLLLMAPYVFTILVLVIGSRETLRRRLGAPAALGTPYTREE